MNLLLGNVGQGQQERNMGDLIALVVYLALSQDQNWGGGRNLLAATRLSATRLLGTTLP